LISKRILVTTILAFLLVPAFAYSESGTIPVNVDETIYNIVYNAEGVKINSITPDYDFLSLILEVEVEPPGMLEITFERAYFDSTFEGEDEPFFVLGDGDIVPYAERGKTEQTRTLILEVPTGTEEVEIIGSHLLQGTIGTTAPTEMPVEEPVMMPEEEPPVPVEEPETMPEEEPPMETIPVKEDASKCGPGTILKDGKCVLDERCGPGTHFEDGACVLDEKEPTTSVGFSLGSANTSQLVIPAIIGFGIAFFVMIILWLIGRAGRSKPAVAASSL